MIWLLPKQCRSGELGGSIRNNQIYAAGRLYHGVRPRHLEHLEGFWAWQATTGLKRKSCEAKKVCFGSDPRLPGEHTTEYLKLFPFTAVHVCSISLDATGILSFDSLSQLVFLNQLFNILEWSLTTIISISAEMTLPRLRTTETSTSNRLKWEHCRIYHH